MLLWLCACVYPDVISLRLGTQLLSPSSHITISIRLPPAFSLSFPLLSNPRPSLTFAPWLQMLPLRDPSKIVPSREDVIPSYVPSFRYSLLGLIFPQHSSGRGGAGNIRRKDSGQSKEPVSPRVISGREVEVHSPVRRGRNNSVDSEKVITFNPYSILFLTSFSGRFPSSRPWRYRQHPFSLSCQSSLSRTRGQH